MDTAESIKATFSDGLLIRGLFKSYGPFVALRDVNVSFRRGEITALLGPNGAGKSTLLKVLSGCLNFDRGSLCLMGHPYLPTSPKWALDHGVAAIYQEQSLIDDWAVWEHFAPPNRSTWLNRKEWLIRARQALAFIAADIDVYAPIRNLRASERQVVEIAKALALDARVLLVDEPTVGLDLPSRRRIFDALRAAAERGCAVIVASHDLATCIARSDSVVMLRAGSIVFQRPAANTAIQDVAQITYREYPPNRPASPDNSTPVLKAWPVNDGQGIPAPILEGHAAEIVGIATHALSGARELLRSIAGVEKRPWAISELDGQSVTGEPAARFRQGIAYVSRERSTEWLFEEHSIERNLNAATFPDLSRAYFLFGKREAENAGRIQGLVNLGAHSLTSSVLELSGGNRQKTVIGRALSASPRVLLLDEPFSGVDAETRHQLSGVLREFVGEGRCVLVLSREFDDLLATCDRIVVFRRDVIEPLSIETPGLSAHQLEALVSS
jgi:ABC-type sugar transport system ATPase subunit